jgi:hypothetical protein
VGLFGGLSGVLIMGSLGATILAEPPGAGRGLAIVPLVMAALFVPSVWASVAGTPSRQAILRGSVAASLAMAFTASFVFGVAVLVLLLPPTVLLWLASGGVRPKR